MKCPKCGGISINKGNGNKDKFSWLILAPIVMDGGGRYPVKFKCLKCKHIFLYE